MNDALFLYDLVGHLIRDAEAGLLRPPSFAKVEEPERIWDTLLFCILSSQVSVKTAARAADNLNKNVGFFEHKHGFAELEENISLHLRSDVVRYRFPRTKSRQITHSWFPFVQVHREVHDYLNSFDTERLARNSVVALFPGIGLKQASMFLRDIGYSKQLAIIDTHILWYFQKTSRLQGEQITPRLYMELEDILLRDAENLRIDLNLLDVAIWTAVRTVKARQCTMQFA